MSNVNDNNDDDDEEDGEAIAISPGIGGLVLPSFFAAITSP